MVDLINHMDIQGCMLTSTATNPYISLEIPSLYAFNALSRHPLWSTRGLGYPFFFASTPHPRP